VGSGGGVFYYKHKDLLIKKNNRYTCIDIDAPSIEYSKQKCNYVDFFVKDICDFTEKDFKQYDMLLLIQSYIQIPNIENVFKKYFKANTNGCIMMINTIFPYTISNIASLCKNHILPLLLNNNCVSGRALTLNDIDELGTYLERKITNINICKSLSGFDEYLTIIR
jgi:2-polyprenyl-3-methyl-5-hydroxy-6-metoxy-1,4-benzoquinol methylase